jgi:hypothetical protein
VGPGTVICCEDSRVRKGRARDAYLSLPRVYVIPEVVSMLVGNTEERGIPCNVRTAFNSWSTTSRMDT